MIEAISEFSNYLEKYGGHNQAAGFSLSKERFNTFKKQIQQYARKHIPKEALQKTLEYDFELSMADITSELVGWIEQLAPFGYENPTPSFVIRNVCISNIGFVGSARKHVRLGVEGVSAIGFNLADRFGNLREDDTIDLLTTIGWNEWNGHKKIQLSIKDIKIKS
jgi:single-stranded-DNA-specific exonuclease